MSTDELVALIPQWDEEPDYFVWEAFDRASVDPARCLSPGALQQQALLAETTHFYVVPDQFGVVEGHVLLIPKRPTSSIASLDERIDEEVAWLLDRTADVVAATYGAQVVRAEHGECGCTTAGQAHVHVLPVSPTVTPDRLRAAIDRVLARRMVGIECVTYKDTRFTALEDLQMLVGMDGAEATGRQVRCADLDEEGPYPKAARTASGLVRPYVYFSGCGVSFLSLRSLRSQFAREVVAVVSDHPEGTWDRRVHTDRGNMFATFARLAPAFRRLDADEFGFVPRAGQPADQADQVAGPIDDMTVGARH